MQKNHVVYSKANDVAIESEETYFPAAKGDLPTMAEHPASPRLLDTERRDRLSSLDDYSLKVRPGLVGL
jgi:hypothetical protein